jgi:hypothetical protein
VRLREDTSILPRFQSTSLCRRRIAPRSKRFEAIIDSGSSGCIFHASIGRAIGLDIEKGEVLRTLGIAGSAREFLHDISLSVAGEIIATRAGFSDDLPIAGILGMKGFFEHFRIVFDPIAHGVELERIFRA